MSHEDTSGNPPQTLAELRAPDGTWVYLPGDENGMLAVNPDTVVDDIAEGAAQFWSQLEGDRPEAVAKIKEEIRSEAEQEALWLIANNGKVPNEFQLNNNIHSLISDGSPVIQKYISQLAFHPDVSIRHRLAQSYLLDPKAFAKILELDDMDKEISARMGLDQSRLLRVRGLDTSRFGISYENAMTRIQNGSYPPCLTEEERAAARWRPAQTKT